MLRLHGQYAYMMAELADPRADSLPLMSSVWPTIVLCCSYVYLITVAGPRSSLLLIIAFLNLVILCTVSEDFCGQTNPISSRNTFFQIYFVKIEEL